MATPAVSQPPPEVGQQAPLSYASILKPPATKIKPVPLKPIKYLRGEPIALWDQAEVDQMIIDETFNMQ